MAKITRVAGNLKAFALNAVGAERTIFGGSPTQSDDLTDNITSEFLRGWGYIPLNTLPSRKDFNALGFTSTQLIAYLNQMGVSEWDIAQEYEFGSASIVSGNIYISKAFTANIGNNPLTDTTNWKRLAALEEVEDADLINYDNSISGLSSINVQDAIDEVVIAANIKYNNSLSGLIADEVQAVIDELSGRTVIPVGSIQHFAMATAPNGWITCDGSAVSRTVKYNGLYAVISSTYGDGDGSTTFNLPDLRGKFIRVYDSSGLVDPLRTFGDSQVDAMEQHSHYSGIGTIFEPDIWCGAGHTNTNSLPVTRSAQAQIFGAQAAQYDGITSDLISSGVAMTAAGTGSNATTNCKLSSTETRPRNIAMNICIKY